ncbi:A/G-specific adenine glycosylase [Flavobacterium sp. IMCC34852]|uniref:Adenine DNA glycosylase n=1 Tax=Flavobacterium rivulicola TaxID=2732161 RepID=A0A7Y3R7D9_9FLAO|nr:A/G-specific adenine glycosylase [Flavobacterium sp. IMCC34852]NNT71294.1 A/G-specific adenine glycosylase [Flavobacterium sp. IMCC34852]
MNFSKSLILWYLQNKRDLPWRNTVNPYFIWLSEIMLQQTRVAQGLPYFLRFTKAFPTVFDLANATEEEVLKLWQGLGYYSRARNLHKTAQQVAFEFNGEFPRTYAELLKLKGIGEYTAAAIASFSYNESVPVVDGNVYRVLSRYFDVETDIASSGAKKEFTKLAAELLPQGEANLFNQAIMEFGALQCVPKNPDCGNCIFSNSCLALQKKKVASLPVKSKKTKVRTRYFNYLVFLDENTNTLLQKRTQKGIWYNLYEFPLLETEKELTETALLELMQNQPFVTNKVLNIHWYNSETTVHKLTHQHLNINFWKIVVKGKLEKGIDWESAKKMPFPIVIYNFIEKERF